MQKLKEDSSSIMNKVGDIDNSLFDRSNETYWYRKLLDIQNVVNIPFYPKEKIQSNRSKFTKIGFKDFSSQSYNKFDILIATLIYLYKINNHTNYTVAYTNDHIHKLDEKKKLEVSKYVPLTVKFDPNENFINIHKIFKAEIKELEDHKTYDKKLGKYVEIAHKKILNTFDLSIHTVKSIDNFDLSAQSNIYIIVTNNLEIFIYVNQKIIQQNEELLSVIKRFIFHISNILKSGSKNNQQLIKELQILPKKEYNKIIKTWNDTKEYYPKDKTLQELFENQVKKHPNNIAVTFQNSRLTYKELNNKANQLAHYLRKLGVTTETLVAICVSRNLDMIVGILGILKSGGAYVPLDSDYPSDRIKFMLEDSNTKFVVTQKHIVKTLSILIDNKRQLVCLDSDLSKINQCSSSNPKIINNVNNLIYIIYTSGSTGKPKGVMIQQDSLVDMALFSKKEISAKHTDTFAQFLSTCYDGSGLAIWTSLLTSAHLHIVPDKIRKSPVSLYHFLIKNSINIIHFFPTILNSFPNTPIKKMKALLVGGEPCDENTSKFWAKHTRLINAYGPTEATVISVTYIFPKNHKKVLIGKPCANTQAYILDEYLNPVPIGVPGELHIGGIGLARGYFNRPELTKQKFIKNPFSKDKNSKIYKTGDLCRWLPDGNIDYLGRIDDQIKIRGFRVELEEINHRLQQYSDINQSVVVVKKSNKANPQIIAYIICHNKSIFQADKCKTFLKETLPDFMIPARFVLLDKFPTTPGGKVSKKALLEIKENKTSVARSVKYKAPETKNEKILINIWSDILDINKEQIGVRDDFFDIGGDSLNVNKMLFDIQRQFKTNISIEYLYKNQNIENIAKLIEPKNQTKSSAISIKKAKISKSYPLSYQQELIWFHAQIEPYLPIYNEPMVLNIKETIQPKYLEKSINELIKRHEILRTNIIYKNGKLRQIIRKFKYIKIQYINLSKCNKKEKKSLRIAKKKID